MMSELEIMVLFDEAGRGLAKQAFSASNRMSSALSAVRTRLGAFGGPRSAGRIAGAPAVHTPSMMGVPRVGPTTSPSLGFPTVPKISTR